MRHLFVAVSALNTQTQTSTGFGFAFDWYGTSTQLEPGKIKAYNLLDAQVCYRIPNLKTTVKFGTSNLTNQKIVQAFGLPSVRGLYFISLTFDEMIC